VLASDQLVAAISTQQDDAMSMNQSIVVWFMRMVQRLSTIGSTPVAPMILTKNLLATGSVMDGDMSSPDLRKVIKQTT
jgi:hypothetical protein